MKKRLKITYNAPVILTYVLLCFVVTLLGLLTADRSTNLLFCVYRSSLLDPLSYLRIIGHVLGHAGLAHFFSNAMYLLLLGPMLEEKYGRSVLIKVILLTAVVTGLIHCALWPATALCGASGVVFACIVLSSFTAFRDGELPLSFILVAVLYIGAEIFNGLSVQDNVSNLTHVLGGAVGGLCGYWLNRKK